MTAKAVLPRTAASAAALSGALSGALMVHVRPKMATDAKLDILPMLKGVTVKNVKAKAPIIAKALDAALKGKLAKDADLDTDEVKDIVEQVAEVMADNSEAIAAEVAPDVDVDATVDEDDAQLRDMLKAKGLTDEQIDAICKGEMPPPPPPAEDEEAKKVEAKQATDQAIRAATRDMVGKAEAKKMAEDAASAAVQAAVGMERSRQRDLRDAEAHVRPVVGALAVAQDNAEGVFREALKALNVSGAADLPEAALRPVFDAHAAVKAAPAARVAEMATDSAIAGKSFEEMFPDSKRFLG